MSTDGGSVWTVKDYYYADGGDLISDPNNNAVYWSGGRYYDTSDSLYKMTVSKTTDSGDTWTRYILGSGTGYLYAMAMDPDNSNIVYAGGYESASAIYRTTNSGSSWTRLLATGLSGYVYDLAIDSDNTSVIYAGTSSNLYKSTDSGSTWSTTGFSGGRAQTVCIDNSSTDANLMYVGTYYNGVFRGMDNGMTWESYNDGLEELNINTLEVNPNNYIFAGTNGGSMYRWLITVGVQENTEITAGHGMFFVTPNPAKGHAVLNFQIQKETPVELSVYDIQGRLVSVLFKDISHAGTHQIAWQGVDNKENEVPAGVYFCRLTTDQAIYIQKLILVR